MLLNLNGSLNMRARDGQVEAHPPHPRLRNGMKKSATFLLPALASFHAALADESVAIREGSVFITVRTDGQRDWRANHYRVENGQIVTIRADGQRDWNANVYRIEGGQLAPVSPQGKRDWNAPAISLKK
ncbi:MAG: hypothetical protein HY016_00045 [Nitrosomonadales bacterium]|nr:hypothetical protein [Nitrosomonadales bacterium]